MILAAGRGQRLAPLTETLPKPLIEIGGVTLIERHLVRLAAVGIDDIVINLAHLGDMIETHLGDGHRHRVRIAYSHEPDGALEAGGGIAHALSLLGPAPFLVLNADIWTDCPFPRELPTGAQAHLMLVANPPHHPRGDFSLDRGRIWHATDNAWTYAGIGIYAPDLFRAPPAPRFPLAPLLFELGAQGVLSGACHAGLWFDIGTLERLERARAAVAEGPNQARAPADHPGGAG